MLEGLYAASSGMEAMQGQFNAVSNDLANMDTPGYQGEEVGFRSLLYTQGGASTGSHVATGAGAASAVVGTDQSEGALDPTGRSLDVAVNGPGFLQVRRPDGSVGLTRDGRLQVDADGHLTDQVGQLLDPPVTVPKGTDASSVKIAADGRVTAGGRQVGRLTVVDVPAPSQLQAVGNSTFAPTTGSGAVRPASGTTVQQGALESSNVDMAQEMADMVNAQRTYQMAGQAVQYQDQMLQIANQLRK